MNNKKQIKFILEGDTEDLQILADLQAEGKLEGLLNELKSDDMPEIKVIEVGFIDDQKVIEKCELINSLREGEGNKQNLSNIDLRGANLKEANLTETNLIGADLSYANLIGANLTRTNFTNANLTGADLTDAILIDTDFTNANLTRVVYS